MWEDTFIALDVCEDISFILNSTANGTLFCTVCMHVTGPLNCKRIFISENLLVQCSQMVYSLLDVSSATKYGLVTNISCILSALNQAIELKNKIACAFLLQSLHSFAEQPEMIHGFGKF